MLIPNLETYHIFSASISYSHLVPQLIRHPEIITGPMKTEDPFGQSFLEKISLTRENIRRARLNKIQQALSYAVPQMKKLIDTKDLRGIPHLEAVYKHWRPQGAYQTEEEFSDGTLRLIGLLWSILEGNSVLLLEEPELSLHSAIVQILPSLIWRLQSKEKASNTEYTFSRIIK